MALRMNLLGAHFFLPEAGTFSEPNGDPLFPAFIGTVEQIMTHALGEHDPGSAQNLRTSNDFCSPGCQIVFFP